MSCDISTNKWDDLSDFNEAGLEGLNEYIDDLKSKGIEPNVVGKFGGLFGDAVDVAKAGKQVSDGNIKGAVATVSGAFFGGVGAAAGYAVAGFLFPGLGLVGAIVLAGTAGALIGDLAESITESMLDPTLEPKFHEELLRNREQRLREKGIDPATDPGVANMRRQLDLARKRAGMCDEINEKFNDATTTVRRDPLALDLDNDGIETIAINPSAPILFDHNGDGASSATGWLKGDDGWLVNDLDQDGLITSGKELLGVDTDITVGGVTRKATTGFEALRALDSHQVDDGKNLFDSRDAAFSQLLVWQDKNQNGMTDAGELSTLSALGIVSIQLQETTTDVDLGGGNSITGKALVTRRVATSTSTSTSEVDSVLVTNDSAANLNLADNPFYTDLPDVAVTDTARNLPNMQGSGHVHSLREAMSLGNAASNALTATVQAFAAANTRDAQMVLLDKLIAEWGATSNLATSGNPATGSWLPTSVTPNTTLSATTQQRIKTFAEQNPEMYRKVIVLEQFNGQLGLSTLMNRWNVKLPSVVDNLLNEAYSTLRESVYGALTVQTRLKPYLDAVNVIVGDQGLRFDLTELSALIASKQSTDISKAIIEVLELSQYAGATLLEIGFESATTMRSLLSSAPSNLPLLSQLPTLGLFQTGATRGTSKNDVYLGDQGSNSFKAGDGSDLLSGDAGNDTLYGDAGNDTLDGGSGNDYLVGGSDPYWDENTGIDVYLFGRGSGQDTISNGSIEAAGSSPDTILLGAGITTTDLTLTYLGDDLIIRLGGTSDSLRVVRYFDRDGTTSGMVESIQFTDGTVWKYATVKAKVMVPSTGNDRLQGSAANDTINSGAGNDTIYGYAGNDVLEGGTGIDDLYGGEGDDRIDGDEHRDSLYGDAGADTLSGGAGIDYLSGGDGNDSIQGNEDNDFLLGEDGNDTLEGGGGDDTLRGGQGADVYLFGKGSGQDSLYNEDTDALGTNPDTILLGTGISTADINLAKSNRDLIIGINGTSDRLIVNEYFYNDGVSKHVVENLKFASGATWDVKTVLNKFTVSTDGADVLYGTPDADAIDGRAGNDTIYAGLGSDTYKFGKGDGRDVIASIDDTAVGKIDTLLFKPGVTPNEVAFGTAPDPFHTYQLGGGGSLVIKIAGSTDQVTIQHFLENGDPFNTRNPLQAIKFEDGTTWGIQTILSKLYAGTDAADIINGTNKGELITGGAGNDSLDGGSGRDTLHGGSGNDYIDEGSDDGNDTFLFGKGDGQDTISGGQDNEPGEINTLLFKQGVTPSEVTFGTDHSALIVKIAGSTDQIVAYNFLNEGRPANGYAFQQIKFADGTLWKVADILSKLYAGTESADSLVGTTYNEAINGQSGDDSLFGGDGDDTLSGGVGNDSLYGESRNDQLIGGSGDDLMDGGKGNDTLIGGAGNDIYIVDALLDKVIESSDEGSDTIQTSVSYAAPDHVERMNATGSSNIKLTANNMGMVLLGNTGNNQLVGGTGADRLYSSAGNDTLIGGLGNDLYYISDLNDAIVERANEGADIVFSFVDNFVLASGVETLNMVQGRSAFGNDEANKINGNSGHNVIEGRGGFDNIKGGDGNDVLRGGAQRDNLGGGAGNDTYIMAVGDGVDFIFNEDALGHDVLMFEGVSEQQLWFSQTGIGLNVSVMGQSTGVNIVGWQSGAANQVDEIKVGSTGKTLSASKVANLIQVMSTMVPPAANQTSLSAAQQAQLAPVLAANWV